METSDYNVNGKEFNIDDQTDNDDDIEGNNKLKEKERKMSSLHFTSVILTGLIYSQVKLLT